MPVEGNVDDVARIINKAWQDPCCHATFAELIRKVGFSIEKVDALFLICAEVHKCYDIFGCRIAELYMQGAVYA